MRFMQVQAAQHCMRTKGEHLESQAILTIGKTYNTL